VQIAVSYAPTAVTNNSNVLTMISDDPNNPQIEIPLTGSGALPVLVVSTTNLDFGNIAVGSNSELSVTVSNAGAASAIIDSISVSSGSGEFILDPLVTTTQFSLRPGAANVVGVQFVPVQQGAVTGAVQINSPGAVTPTLTVNLSGTGQQCNLSVDQSALDFGTVAQGTTNSLTLTISNSGNSTCQVDSVTVVGNGQMTFTGPASFAVPPGTNVVVDVQYVPVNAQTIIILGGSVRGPGKPVKVSP